MFEYIEEILHRKIEYSQYDKVYSLPLLMTGSYDFYTIKIENEVILLAVPIVDINLSSLRKQQKRMEVLTGMHCVLYMKNMTYYSRDRMIEENIPFVWEGKQIYIPHLGMALNSNTRSELPYCTKISFLTQRLLLTAIYQQWKGVNVTEAASALSVSKMSISRCYDELEALEVTGLRRSGRTRTLTCQDKRKFWDSIKPVLIDPVISRISLKQNISEGYAFGGISALAGYTMLADDPYPTYALTKKNIGNIDINRGSLIPPGETPGCVIHKVGYWIDFGDGTKLDPLSVALSIREDDRRDPRVEQAIEEMLEEYVW